MDMSQRKALAKLAFDKWKLKIEENRKKGGKRQQKQTREPMESKNESLPPQMSEEEDENVSDKEDGNRRFEARTEPRIKNSESIKGRRAIFYRNGDPNFKGRRVNVNRKSHQTLNILMTDLNSMIETPSGVEYIFSWPEGKLIESVTEIQDQQAYIVSSVRKLNRDVKYGKSREQYWQTGKPKHDDVKLIKGAGGMQNGSPNYKKPRVFTIVSNMHRNSWEKVILNPDTKQNFEDIMADIADMIYIPEPPLRALYQMGKTLPFRPIESLTTLFRECKDGDTLLACGEEKIPNEMQPKRPAPSSHSSDSGTGGTSRKRPMKKLQLESSQSSRGEVSQIFDVSPTRNLRVGSQLVSRKSWNDACVRVKINGKFKEFYPPTVTYYEEDGGKPDKSLKLDWVYGYNGNDPRSALLVLPDTGELVYYVSCVAVLYDRTSATQRYYLGHTEEITCMVLLPDGEKIATGQQSGKTAAEDAHVRIWDGHSLSTYFVIGLGAFSQGVLSIAFSPDMENDLMLVVDDSDKHVLSVWQYKTEKCLAQTGTTGDPVMQGCFYPFDDTIIITYGKGHLFFWKLDWDKYKIWRDKKSGLTEEDMPKQVQVTALTFTSTGEVVIGDSTGSITVWQRDEKDIFSVDSDYSFMKKAHKRSVNALCVLEDGTLLSGGGNTVRAWDTMNRFKRVKERQIPEMYGHVRSIVPQISGGYDGGLFIGTTRSHVLEGSLQTNFSYLVQGHSEELWAIATSPTEPVFVTAGHDQFVVKWSAVSHHAIWKVQVERPCVSIAIEPKGRLVALGTTAGRLIILNAKNGSHLQTIQAGQVQINAISFSQDGQSVALGDHDGYIYLFSAGDDGHIYATHSSLLVHNVRDNFITQLDWSNDGTYIQAVTGDYDIVFFDVEKLQKVRFPKVIRDVDWYTQTCTVGYPLAGAWQSLKGGEVINVATRSNYRDFIATGDNKGRLRLYKFPCSANKPEFHNKKAYSTNVTAVAFTCDDSHMISSGGQGTGDTALFQWALVNPSIQR
ncbi:echinoderm microtubule-associated protein-like 2 isoform X2 [Gigantopelta aegis]|uniref:echinoderm microtubule-associated protein-like 2 isoform X2 n=1 Tax=Gigantopelta aegis TaxID=1735272 RepID=UPI001B88916B|nr:echinoderm microtubule-associated protein-like 2 isoform X2 [Gigantopelta aegis]